MTMKPYIGDKEQTCPQRGGKPCWKACPTCNWYRPFKLLNIQTQQPHEHWDCAPAFHAALTMEQTGRVAGVQAATESFRNEMVAANRAATSAMAGMALPRPSGSGYVLIDDQRDRSGTGSRSVVQQREP